MSNIVENLRKILTARYGRDVRQSIHDAIHDCYEDGKAGATDIVAREMIADVEAQIAPATTEKAGTVKPDGETITVDADGTIHGSASLPDNVVVFKDESTPSTPAPRDADRLGGFLPSHFYSGSYSTEEQVVGTWIDGKPIYRRVLTGMFDNNGETVTQFVGTGFLNSFNASSYDIDCLINYQGELFFDGKGRVPIPCIFNTGQFINVYYNYITDEIQIRHSAQYIGNFYLVLEYTKTTD